jgi:hypothetical protein
MQVPARWLPACVFIFLAGAVSARGTWAQSVADKFADARPAIQRQLKSRKVESRLDALAELRQYPVPEAARLAHGCVDDPDEGVRRAAYDTLVVLGGEQEVCDTLAELATQGMQDKHWAAKVPPAVAALLSSNLPIARLRVQQLLDKTLAASPRGLQIALAVADALATRRRPEDVLALGRLSQSKLFAEHFGVRRGVVNALAEIPSKEAVGTMIAMLDRVGGEAKADAADHLTAVTGQIFGMDAQAWQRWWQQTGPTFVYPRLSANAPRTAKTEGPGGYYYGLPLLAERLVFVLDISGSMEGPRMMAAKRELIKAVRGLPDNVHFSVVVYNEVVRTWKRTLVPADEKMKDAAVAFIEALVPRSNTASYDALQEALTFDAEAIYFLSDGAPTSGKILAPADIIAAITAANKLRRITIYTIGIAPGFPGSPTDAFLKTLSEQNYGEYRRVDG